MASYNVAHSSAVTGQGIVLDWEYLASLGPHAIPAMDAYPRESAWTRERNQLADGFMRQTSDWRAWTYRDHRLKRYLDQREAAAPK